MLAAITKRTSTSSKRTWYSRGRYLHEIASPFRLCDNLFHAKIHVFLSTIRYSVSHVLAEPSLKVTQSRGEVISLGAG